MIIVISDILIFFSKTELCRFELSLKFSSQYFSRLINIFLALFVQISSLPLFFLLASSLFSNFWATAGSIGGLRGRWLAGRGCQAGRLFHPANFALLFPDYVSISLFVIPWIVLGWFSALPSLYSIPNYLLSYHSHSWQARPPSQLYTLVFWGCGYFFVCHTLESAWLILNFALLIYQIIITGRSFHPAIFALFISDDVGFDNFLFVICCLGLIWYS